MDANDRSPERLEASAEVGESPASAIQIDPAASAALAEAIKSARQGLKPAAAPARPAKQTRSGGLTSAATRRASAGRIMAQAAVAALLIGAGWFASYIGTLANQDAIRQLEAETARSQQILTRLSSDLESLRGTMAAFKEVDQTSSITSVSAQDKLSDKVERLAIALQDPGKKLSALEVRLDRMESQITTGLANLTAKPSAPAATEAAVREEPPAPKNLKSEPVDGWILREVYDGAALVEGRNRRLYEVAPGGILPGVGRVEGIERRGARWVVMTEKGFIGTYQ